MDGWICEEKRLCVQSRWLLVNNTKKTGKITDSIYAKRLRGREKARLTEDLKSIK